MRGNGATRREGQRGEEKNGEGREGQRVGEKDREEKRRT